MGSNHNPSPDASKGFLGDAINIATRSVHTRLNKLILLRLPLAIPPRADGPLAYTQGILHIAPLYISFESLWHAALHSNDTNTSDSAAHQPNDSSPRSTSPRPFPFRSRSDNNPSFHGPQPSKRVHTVLNELFIPGLLRSSRLRSDLRSLTGWSDSVLQSRLEEVATTGRLGEIVSHIRRAVTKHPHVILAYAWVLYMALFSGGRFIRATLESAGAHGLWTAGEEKRKVPVHGPLDFFHFPTPQDGEDLKHEFKQRLAEVGGLLSEGEREDIVREGISIFENLILVINQLDDACHTRMEDLNAVDASVLSPRSAGFRIRDSVIVTRERSYRAQQRSQPEQEDESEAEDTEEPAKPDRDTEEGSSNSTSTSSTSSSDSDGKPQPAMVKKQPPPQLARYPSCHTVQLASASPRIEKGDPFSRLASRTRSESSNMDPEQADSLARAMRFDLKLPVPERTPSVTKDESQNLTLPDRSTGSAPKKGESQSEGGEAETDTPEPRQRSDSTMARGIQVASALGLAVAVVVAYSRG